ncbi:hypothetical protein H6F93_05410 [Leptolyngbya sp. FACHB-671]|uniref:hypothetical protein n=1 Tax=Leptolyngbya sp. FACHB-671 TaxID=2692812 RepID=UPI001681D0A5|nr:hypothetical protein [Leptolyngbya sp. FACHB-671]MBD2066972.1 hypothetical protein [Leptolyngbya sp. FACHB-671]
MKYSPLFSALLIVSAVVVSACGSLSTNSSNETQSTSPTSPLADSPEVVVVSPDGSSSSETSEESSPSAEVPAASGATSYQEPNDLFQISFPEGYTHQETGSGIAFVSADKGFGGSVDFGAAQGGELSTEDLEKALKEEYENRLEDVAWQGSQIQPDGSIRVDWVGRDTDGNDLDAISFVEQRGDTIFILNLYGINKAYADYNADAETIVGSYRVRQQ